MGPIRRVAEAMAHTAFLLIMVSKPATAVVPAPPPAPTTFLLGTNAGVLVWNVVGGLVCSLFVHLVCKWKEIYGYARALLDIYIYKMLQRTSSVPADSGETHACVNAAMTAENLVQPDLERQNQEVGMLEELRSGLRDVGNVNVLPVTTAASDVPNSVLNNTSSPQDHISGENTSNSGRQLTIVVHLPNTLRTPELEAQLEEAARRELLILQHEINAPDFSFGNGSTFLTIKVPFTFSTDSRVDDLLLLTQRLVRIGRAFDPLCTAQLGSAAILYSTGEDVRTTLLNHINAVPMLTSAVNYEAKILVMKGTYLEGTQIKASTPLKTVTLDVLYHRKLNNGLEMLLARLSADEPLNVVGTLVYANKTIKVEGCPQPLVIRSNGEEIKMYCPKQKSSILGTLCTKESWICLLILYILQVVILQSQQLLLKEWIFQFIILFLSYCLVEYIVGPWSFQRIAHFLQTILLRSTIIAPLKRKIVSLGRARSKGPINNPNWEWPCYDYFMHDGRWVKEKAIARPVNDVEEPFEVVSTVNLGVTDKKEDTELIFHSPLLIQVLKGCQPKSGLRFAQGLTIDAREIFLRRQGLKSYLNGSTTCESIKEDAELQLAMWHVNHLLRFVERHFADALVQHEQMKTEKCVSFEMLWSFLVPGEKVRRRCLVTNEECFATVDRIAQYRKDHRVATRGVENCYVRLSVMDFNVQNYHECTMEYQIPTFDGEVAFTSLQVCPLQFFPPDQREDMEVRFLSMGSRFYQVAMQHSFLLMEFQGSMNFYDIREGGYHSSRELSLRKLNSDGRVMIDLLSFARMQPEYPLGNAQPPCEVMTGIWKPDKQIEKKKPSDEELKFSPAFAYGFSFRLKKWGCFELNGLREIRFNQGAFHALRMKNEEQKMILWSVVQEYILVNNRQNERNADVIADKGTGCIVLCYGPPGTGKTLTAEALAETLQCSLWSISAFELGSDATDVERTLSDIMAIAYKWRAILLLDEADAYLERRDSRVDVRRNMVTGVFLRMLEYYRGIMFLTTNRVMVFDDAIMSRTTLAISYPALDDTQRLAIWKKLLTDAGIHNVTDEALLTHHLNGRQIRNIIHLAQLLARSRHQSPQITHVINALKAFHAGIKDLQMLPPLPSS